MADPNKVVIPVSVDASGVDPGVAKTADGMKRIGDAVGAVQGPMTEAEAAAKRFGVSVDVAQAALDRIKAQDKAAQVEALAVAMRESSSAAEESAEASGTVAAAEETEAEAAQRLQAIMREHQQALMRNAFYVHRLAEGFKDMSMGGRLASQGVMDVSESLQYMLGPEYAIWLAGLQVVGMLGMLATSHRGAGEAARDHAKSEEEAATAIKEATDKGTESIISLQRTAADTHLEALRQQLRDYLDIQKELIAQQDTWDNNAAKRLKSLQDETEAQQRLSLSQLKNQEQKDLNAATSQSQKDAITASYAVRELDLKGGSATEKFQAQLAALALEKKSDDEERAALVADNQDNQAKLLALLQQASATARTAKGEGFAPDEAGSFAAQIRDREEALKQARDAAVNAQDAANPSAYEKAHADAGNVLAQMDIANKQQAAKDAEQKVTDISKQLADLRDAETARKALADDGKELETAIKANSAAIEKLVTKLDDIASRGRVAATDYQTATTDIGTDRAKASADADKVRAEQAWKAWREAIHSSGEQNRGARNTERAEEKEHREQIENLTGQIEATGNRPMIEAMHRVLDVFKGKADEQSQMAEIAQLMNVMATTSQTFRQQTKASLNEARRRIDQLGRSAKNNAL